MWHRFTYIQMGISPTRHPFYPSYFYHLLMKTSKKGFFIERVENMAKFNISGVTIETAHDVSESDFRKSIIASLRNGESYEDMRSINNLFYQPLIDEKEKEITEALNHLNQLYDDLHSLKTSQDMSGRRIISITKQNIPSKQLNKYPDSLIELNNYWKEIRKE